MWPQKPPQAQGDQAMSIAELVKKASSLIGGARAETASQRPPAASTQSAGADPAWYDLAETLLGLAEPDPRILTFFKATDLRPLPTSTDTPWGAAFIAHCLAECGDPRAARTIPNGSAAASSWRGWGAQLPPDAVNVPVGAIVVLAPRPGTGASGHVGFFERFDGGSVWLLGGNHDNAVSRKAFERSRIVAIGWLDLKPAAKVDHGADPHPSAGRWISDAAFDLIVESEVTGRKTYEKKYRRPEWPGLSSGITIGIGYDVGYATEAQLVGDWGGVMDDTTIRALRPAIGVTGTRAQELLSDVREKVDIPWEAAIQVHRTKVIPRWVAAVERALPNCNRLPSDCLGALVSLTYNRGASFSKAGDRYSEMRAIKACMAAEDFAAIPGQIRAMGRLWPNALGLRRRREREAALFEAGLSEV
jgi:uncharacterized protein (TIGR02594 family)